MRRALATAGVAGVLALAPYTSAPAHAAPPAPAAVLASQDDTDVDEPLAQDGDDDSGKYGLIGLSGLLGLFGYKKYKDHKARTHGQPIGTVDTDGSGSTRI